MTDAVAREYRWRNVNFKWYAVFRVLTLKNIKKVLIFLIKNVNIILVLEKRKEYNVVIIAKRIHLFPYRTQKLSSLAAMVLGGQLPGRVARSHVVCRSGGTGRRTGLKILRDLPLVPVRFRSSAPLKWTISSVG